MMLREWQRSAWQVGYLLIVGGSGTPGWWGLSIHNRRGAMVTMRRLCGLRRGNAGDSRIVVNEFDIVAMVVCCGLGVAGVCSEVCTM
jgi:hypothetical protein